jgi:hypothetical protein
MCSRKSARFPVLSMGTNCPFYLFVGGIRVIPKRTPKKEPKIDHPPGPAFLIGASTYM